MGNNSMLLSVCTRVCPYFTRFKGLMNDEGADTTRKIM